MLKVGLASKGYRKTSVAFMKLQLDFEGRISFCHKVKNTVEQSQLLDNLLGASHVNLKKINICAVPAMHTCGEVYAAPWALSK